MYYWKRLRIKYTYYAYTSDLLTLQTNAAFLKVCTSVKLYRKLLLRTDYSLGDKRAATGESLSRVVPLTGTRRLVNDSPRVLSGPLAVASAFF